MSAAWSKQEMRHLPGKLMIDEPFKLSINIPVSLYSYPFGDLEYIVY